MSTYSNEFKEQILSMVASGRNTKDVAKEYGIPTVTVNNWCRGSTNPKVKEQIKPERAERTESAEIKGLQAENRRLQMELDILKKAVAIISKM